MSNRIFTTLTGAEFAALCASWGCISFGMLLIPHLIDADKVGIEDYTDWVPYVAYGFVLGFLRRSERTGRFALALSSFVFLLFVAYCIWRGNIPRFIL